MSTCRVPIPVDIVTTARIYGLKEAKAPGFVFANVFVQDILSDPGVNTADCASAPSGHLLFQLPGFGWNIGDKLEITIRKIGQNLRPPGDDDSPGDR